MALTYWRRHVGIAELAVCTYRFAESWEFTFAIGS